MWPHAPRAADIVLEAGPADRRQLAVAVTEDLHLALAVPHAAVERPDADHAAEKSSRPDEAVGDDEIALHRRRVLTAEGRVQQPGIVRQRGLEREVQLEVALDVTGRTIVELDA